MDNTNNAAKLKTINEHAHDAISSTVMPYATILSSDWNKVKILIGDECQVRGFYLSDRAFRAFRGEWLRRRAAMK